MSRYWKMKVPCIRDWRTAPVLQLAGSLLLVTSRIIDKNANTAISPFGYAMLTSNLAAERKAYLGLPVSSDTQQLVLGKGWKRATRALMDDDPERHHSGRVLNLKYHVP
jgi:hypothetical protein